MTTTTRNQTGQAQANPKMNMRIGLSFFAFILIGLGDGAFGVLIPSLGAYYHVDKATIGFLFLAGTAGYLVAAFLSGLLAQLLGRRFFLALGAGVYSVAALFISQRPPFFTLPLGMLMFGFGGAIIDAGLNSYIAGLPRNTTKLNYLHAFYGVGALIGPLIASACLAFGLPWNSVYYVWLAFGLVTFAGTLFAFSGPDASAHRTAHHEEGNVLAGALKLRVVWLGAIFLMMYVGTEVSLGSWSYSFLTEERGTAPLLAGWVVSGYWLGLTLGRIFLGRVGERIGNKALIQVCLAGVVIGLLLVWLVPVSVIPALALCLVGFCLGPIFPTTIAFMSQCVSGRLLPSAIGFMASFGSMGAALFPWLAGSLAQAVGLWSLLPYVMVLTGISLVLWLALQAQPVISGEDATGSPAAATS